MLGRFLDWWLAELHALLPAGLRRRRHRGRTLGIAVEPTRIRVNRRENGRLRQLGEAPIGAGGELSPDDRRRLQTLAGRLRPEDTSVEVLVARELALAREADLPSAARENLYQVLGFEMQRLTPFSAEDVYYSHEVIEQRDDVLRVRLVAVPRRFVDRATEWLAGWTLRLAPDASVGPDATAASDGGEPVLLSFFDARYRGRRRRGLLIVLLTLNLLLACAAIAIPVVREQQRLDRVVVRLEEVRRSAETAAATSREIERSWAKARFIATAANERVSVAALLEELTERIPDTAWIFRLELRDGALQLQGTSEAAASLIALLERSEMLSNVRFDSSVMLEGNTGRERFRIAADVAAPERRE